MLSVVDFLAFSLFFFAAVNTLKHILWFNRMPGRLKVIAFHKRKETLLSYTKETLVTNSSPNYPQAGTGSETKETLCSHSYFSFFRRAFEATLKN